ncbi:hypothetical protein KTE52_05185 [Burkholderia multivorans]|uniref:Uncharacterized protein n=1 Tax=Burkholderia multivorans TaxID=87883 RepID=A0AAP2MM60_9BURK|nr:hypothetical protein [Burkholderia multivorans]MBU9355726.1 hypothetical protein [Burkholderia multivorans]
MSVDAMRDARDDVAHRHPAARRQNRSARVCAAPRLHGYPSCAATMGEPVARVAPHASIERPPRRLSPLTATVQHTPGTRWHNRCPFQVPFSGHAPHRGADSMQQKDRTTRYDFE